MLSTPVKDDALPRTGPIRSKPVLHRSVGLSCRNLKLPTSKHFGCRTIHWNHHSFRSTGEAERVEREDIRGKGWQEDAQTGIRRTPGLISTANLTTHEEWPTNGMMDLPLDCWSQVQRRGQVFAPYSMVGAPGTEQSWVIRLSWTSRSMSTYRWLSQSCADQKTKMIIKNWTSTKMLSFAPKIIQIGLLERILQRLVKTTISTFKNFQKIFKILTKISKFQSNLSPRIFNRFQ